MENERPSHYNTFFIAAIIVAVLLVGAIFIAFLRGGEKIKPIDLHQEETSAPKPVSQPILIPAPPAVPDAIINPVKELPKTNPFEAKINPYKGYKNPFE